MDALKKVSQKPGEKEEDAGAPKSFGVSFKASDADPALVKVPLVVENVVKDSPADRVGVKPAFTLISLRQVPIEEVVDDDTGSELLHDAEDFGYSSFGGLSVVVADELALLLARTPPE